MINFSGLTKLKKKIFKTFAKLLPGNDLRIWFLKQCNYRIGKDVYIGEDLIIIDVLNDPNPYLFIKDRVSISPRVTLVIHAEPNFSKITDFINPRIGPIVIEKDAWIGTGAVILPYVTIGEGAVVGANTVVTKNISPYTIVGGVPAKIIKTVNVPWFDGKGE